MSLRIDVFFQGGAFYAVIVYGISFVQIPEMDESADHVKPSACLLHAFLLEVGSWKHPGVSSFVQMDGEDTSGLKAFSVV